MIWKIKKIYLKNSLFFAYSIVQLHSYINIINNELLFYYFQQNPLINNISDLKNFHADTDVETEHEDFVEEPEPDDLIVDQGKKKRKKHNQ